MNTPPRCLSPKNFADETGLPVPHCAYHFGELADLGCIALVDTVPRRGATEHIYEPLEAALAWTSEWENLKPGVKRSVLSSVLGGAVQALGSAIDSGTFEKRDDSHLSWNTIAVDKPGWLGVAEILDRALEDLLRVKSDSSHRIKNGAASFLVSYFMSSFESPPRGELLYRDLSSGRSPGASKLRPTKDKRRAKRRAARSGLDEQQVMAKAMSHSTRVRILMSMNTPRRSLSPKQFSVETGLPIHHCAYHFGELEDIGCIALVDTRQKRGATEHIYEPRKTAIQWTDDWKQLGPAIKQNVLASVARGAVEALGSAIESGTFESRSDSHLSWDTIEIDLQGWTDLTTIFDRTLTELLAVEKETTVRLADGGNSFSASYFMASFESPKQITLLTD